MDNNNNEQPGVAQKVSKLGKLAKYGISIARTFTGTGTPIDWKNTAIVLLPAAFGVTLLSVIFIYAMVAGPVGAIKDGVHGVVQNVGEWFNKLGNFLTFNGFVDDETKFANTLYDTYEKYYNDNICIDDTAISAVLVYKYMTSTDVEAGNETNIEDEENISGEQTVTGEEIDYDEMTSKIKGLAKKQIYNNSLSNADFLAYLRTSSKATEEERQKMNTTSSSSSSGTSAVPGQKYASTKYNLTDDQLLQIASLAQQEQGSAEGAAAEASLMANRFELFGSGTGADGLLNYVRTSGWFANAGSHMDARNASDEVIAAVRDVLVNGNRTLPLYVDEHDCVDCCHLGACVNAGSNNGTPIDVNDKSQYQSGVTILYNTAGATYTFFSFPTETSDPFGYTEQALNRAQELGVTPESNGAISDSSSTTSTTLSTSSVPENTSAPASTPANVEVIDIPENLGNIHTYTRWDDWNWAYDAGDIIKELGGQNYTGGGYIGANDYGMVTYGQWYAAATTSTFGEVGDMVFFIQDDGSVFPVMIADEKSQEYVAWDNNPANKWGHNEGASIVEFEIMSGSDAEADGGNVLGPNKEFDHYITRAVNVGSAYEHPEYINDVQAALAAANLSGSTFIDVGSVTTSGTNANTNIPLSTSSTQVCPGSLEYFRPTNEEIESTDYTKGFIYKYYKDLFEGYEGVKLNYAVENLIREIYDYKESLESTVYEHFKAGTSSTTLACNITGEFQSWRQYDPEWGSIPLGTSSNTIKSAGCYATSVAILIAKSGTKLEIDNFNPGVFVEHLNANGGFDNGDEFANSEASWQAIAPNWEHEATNVPLTGSREEKTAQLKEAIDSGLYVMVRVKQHPSQHWIAIDRIEGDTVYIIDPASDRTKLWDDGEYTVENTVCYSSFKAIDSAATPISSSGVCAPASGEYRYYNQGPVDEGVPDSERVYFGTYVVPCRGVTLNDVGCSQMSLAIIASGVVSSDITPITVADAYCAVGINTAVSTDMIVQETLMQKLGMVATKLFDEGDSRDQQKAKLQDIVNKGYPVLLNVTNHYVAVIPGSDGKIKLMDPGSFEKTKEYTIDELAQVTWNGATTWRNAYYFTKRS